MHYKLFTNRINRITKELRKGDPDFSVIMQFPGEPDEEVQRRANELEKANTRQFGRPGKIIIVTNYAGKGGNHVK